MEDKKKNLFSDILNTAGQAVGAVGQGVWLSSKPGAAYERGRLNREASQMEMQQMDERKKQNLIAHATQIHNRLGALPQDQQDKALQSLSMLFKQQPELRAYFESTPPSPSVPENFQPISQRVGTNGNEITYGDVKAMQESKSRTGSAATAMTPFQLQSIIEEKQKRKAGLMKDLATTTANTPAYKTIEDQIKSIDLEITNLITPKSDSAWGSLGGFNYGNMSDEEKQNLIANYAGGGESQPISQEAVPEWVTRPATRQPMAGQDPNSPPELPQETPQTSPQPTSQKYGMKESVTVGGFKYTTGEVITRGGKRFIVDHIENGKPKLLPAR